MKVHFWQKSIKTAYETDGEHLGIFSIAFTHFNSGIKEIHRYFKCTQEENKPQLASKVTSKQKVQRSVWDFLQHI